MESFGDPGRILSYSTKITFFLGPIGTAQQKKLTKLIPRDGLCLRRQKNLAKAFQLVVAYRKKNPVGLVFVRKVFGIPNATWLVAQNARGKGLTTRMLIRLKRDSWLVTAWCRTGASRAVARRAGFALVGPVALWLRGIDSI